MNRKQSTVCDRFDEKRRQKQPELPLLPMP